MIKKERFLPKIIMIVFVMFLVFLTPSMAYAATQEIEPNDSMKTAQKVSIGKEYTGAVTDEETDDEDFYRIPVKEGKWYKVTVYNMKDIGEYDWETMIVTLYKDSKNDYGNTINTDDYNKVSKLFKAAYTGDYYLGFDNTTNTEYSFKVEKYDLKGKKVKDSDSNTYKILGNSTVELSKVASKKSSDFYIDSEQYFSEIGGMEVLDYYETEFKVKAIGKYAFKGCNIESISIPNSVKTIGVGAFQDCKKLGTEEYIVGLVIHGKNVVIEKNAFRNCKKLGSVRIIKGASIKSVAKNAFKGTKKGINLEVPSVKKYKKIFKNAGLNKPRYEKSYI